MPSNFLSLGNISKLFRRKARKKVDNDPPKAAAAVRSCSGHRSQRSQERHQLELIADGWHDSSVLDVRRDPSYISSPHSVYNSTITLVPDTPPPSIHSFDFLKYVDKGSFGSIYKVRRTETREIYALKVIQKEGCLEKHIAELIQEQALLRFVVECELGSRYTQLVASWSDTKFLYLLMPLYPTTIWDEVIRCDRLKAERIRFYMAELILAIKDLHAQGIVHRDVKAPNILISRTGHPVLADFGLAHKFPRYPTMAERETQPYYSFHKDNKCDSHSEELVHVLFESCGSPDEMAPELFLGRPYSYSVDFWSLAVTMYFMLSGQYPWEDDDLRSLGKKIIEEPLRFDDALEMDADSRDFLQRMLEKQPQDRLPICEIEGHPYFPQTDWKAHIAHTALPPWLPGTEFKPTDGSSCRPIDFEPGLSYDSVSNPNPFPSYDYCSSQFTEHRQRPKLSPLLRQSVKSKLFALLDAQSRASTLVASTPTEKGRLANWWPRQSDILA